MFAGVSLRSLTKWQKKPDGMEFVKRAINLEALCLVRNRASKESFCLTFKSPLTWQIKLKQDITSIARLSPKMGLRSTLKEGRNSGFGYLTN